MLDKSINFENINNFFYDLANELEKFDESLSLIRFGSSLKYLPEENLDLDVLLISKKKYFKQDIKSLIYELRGNLIVGKNIKGFKLENDKFMGFIKNFIEKQIYLNNCNIHPKYIFGPIDSLSSKCNEPNIYLHFKGPITIEEYDFFCQSFPLHGYSIWQNHQIITKSFDEGLLHNFGSINEDILIQFNEGLKNRVDNSTSIFDVKKCLKKIILNYNIYLSHSEQQNPIKTELHKLNDINLLKKSFYDFFNEIHNSER